MYVGIKVERNVLSLSSDISVNTSLVHTKTWATEFLETLRVAQIPQNFHGLSYPDADKPSPHVHITITKGADKSLAQPTSRCRRT